MIFFFTLSNKIKNSQKYKMLSLYQHVKFVEDKHLRKYICSAQFPTGLCCKNVFRF